MEHMEEDDDKQSKNGRAMKRNTLEPEVSTLSMAVVTKRSVRRKYADELDERAIVHTTDSQYHKSLHRVITIFYLNYNIKQSKESGNTFDVDHHAAEMTNEINTIFSKHVTLLLDSRMIIYAKDLFYGKNPLEYPDQTHIVYNAQTNVDQSIRAFFQQRQYFSCEYAKLIVDAMERRATFEDLTLGNFLIDIKEDSENVVVEFDGIIWDLMSTPSGRKEIWKKCFPMYPHWDNENNVKEEGNLIYEQIKNYYYGLAVAELAPNAQTTTILSNGDIIRLWKEKIDKMILTNEVCAEFSASSETKNAREFGVMRLKKYKAHLEAWEDPKIQTIIERLGMCYEYITVFKLDISFQLYLNVHTDMEKNFTIAAQKMGINLSEKVFDTSEKVRTIIYCQQMYQFVIKFRDPSKYESATFHAGMTREDVAKTSFEEIQTYHTKLQQVCLIYEVSYDLSQGYRMKNSIISSHNKCSAQLKFNNIPTELNTLTSDLKPDVMLNEWKEIMRGLTERINNLSINSAEMCQVYKSENCARFAQVVNELTQDMLHKTLTINIYSDIVTKLNMAKTLENEVQREKTRYDIMVAEVSNYRARVTESIDVSTITVENWPNLRSQIDQSMEQKFKKLIKEQYDPTTALETALEILTMVKNVTDIMQPIEDLLPASETLHNVLQKIEIQKEQIFFLSSSKLTKELLNDTMSDVTKVSSYLQKFIDVKADERQNVSINSMISKLRTNPDLNTMFDNSSLVTKMSDCIDRINNCVREVTQKLERVLNKKVGPITNFKDFVTACEQLNKLTSVEDQKKNIVGQMLIFKDKIDNQSTNFHDEEMKHWITLLIKWFTDISKYRATLQPFIERFQTLMNGTTLDDIEVCTLISQDIAAFKLECEKMFTIANFAWKYVSTSDDVVITDFENLPIVEKLEAYYTHFQPIIGEKKMEKHSFVSICIEMFTVVELIQNLGKSVFAFQKQEITNMIKHQTDDNRDLNGMIINSLTSSPLITKEGLETGIKTAINGYNLLIETQKIKKLGNCDVKKTFDLDLDFTVSDSTTLSDLHKHYLSILTKTKKLQSEIDITIEKLNKTQRSQSVAFPSFSINNDLSLFENLTILTKRIDSFINELSNGKVACVNHVRSNGLTFKNLKKDVEYVTLVNVQLSDHPNYQFDCVMCEKEEIERLYNIWKPTLASLSPSSSSLTIFLTLDVIQNAIIQKRENALVEMANYANKYISSQIQLDASTASLDRREHDLDITLKKYISQIRKELGLDQYLTTSATTEPSSNSEMQDDPIDSIEGNNDIDINIDVDVDNSSSSLNKFTIEALNIEVKFLVAKIKELRPEDFASLHTALDDAISTLKDRLRKTVTGEKLIEQHNANDLTFSNIIFTLNVTTQNNGFKFRTIQTERIQQFIQDNHIADSDLQSIQLSKPSQVWTIDSLRQIYETYYNQAILNFIQTITWIPAPANGINAQQSLSYYMSHIQTNILPAISTVSSDLNHACTSLRALTNDLTMSGIATLQSAMSILKKQYSDTITSIVQKCKEVLKMLDMNIDFQFSENCDISCQVSEIREHVIYITKKVLDGDDDHLMHNNNLYIVEYLSEMAIQKYPKKDRLLFDNDYNMTCATKHLKMFENLISDSLRIHLTTMLDTSTFVSLTKLKEKISNIQKDRSQVLLKTIEIFGYETNGEEVQTFKSLDDITYTKLQNQIEKFMRKNFPDNNQKHYEKISKFENFTGEHLDHGEVVEKIDLIINQLCEICNTVNKLISDQTKILKNSWEMVKLNTSHDNEEEGGDDEGDDDDFITESGDAMIDDNEKNLKEELEKGLQMDCSVEANLKTFYGIAKKLREYLIQQQHQEISLVQLSENPIYDIVTRMQIAKYPITSNKTYLCLHSELKAIQELVKKGGSSWLSIEEASNASFVTSQKIQFWIMSQSEMEKAALYKLIQENFPNQSAQITTSTSEKDMKNLVQLGITNVMQELTSSPLDTVQEWLSRFQRIDDNVSLVIFLATTQTTIIKIIDDYISVYERILNDVISKFKIDNSIFQQQKQQHGLENRVNALKNNLKIFLNAVGHENLIESTNLYKISENLKLETVSGISNNPKTLKISVDKVNQIITELKKTNTSIPTNDEYVTEKSLLKYQEDSTRKMGEEFEVLFKKHFEIEKIRNGNENSDDSEMVDQEPDVNFQEACKKIRDIMVNIFSTTISDEDLSNAQQTSYNCLVFVKKQVEIADKILNEITGLWNNIVQVPEARENITKTFTSLGGIMCDINAFQIQLTDKVELNYIVNYLRDRKIVSVFQTLTTATRNSITCFEFEKNGINTIVQNDETTLNELFTNIQFYRKDQKKNDQKFVRLSDVRSEAEERKKCLQLQYDYLSKRFPTCKLDDGDSTTISRQTILQMCICVRNWLIENGLLSLKSKEEGGVKNTTWVSLRHSISKIDDTLDTCYTSINHNLNLCEISLHSCLQLDFPSRNDSSLSDRISFFQCVQNLLVSTHHFLELDVTKKVMTMAEINKLVSECELKHFSQISQEKRFKVLSGQKQAIYNYLESGEKSENEKEEEEVFIKVDSTRSNAIYQLGFGSIADTIQESVNVEEEEESDENKVDHELKRMKIKMKMEIIKSLIREKKIKKPEDIIELALQWVYDRTIPESFISLENLPEIINEKEEATPPRNKTRKLKEVDAESVITYSLVKQRYETVLGTYKKFKDKIIKLFQSADGFGYPKSIVDFYNQAETQYKNYLLQVYVDTDDHLVSLLPVHETSKHEDFINQCKDLIRRVLSNCDKYFNLALSIVNIDEPVPKTTKEEEDLSRCVKYYKESLQQFIKTIDEQYVINNDKNIQTLILEFNEKTTKTTNFQNVCTILESQFAKFRNLDGESITILKFSKQNNTLVELQSTVAYVTFRIASKAIETNKSEFENFSQLTDDKENANFNELKNKFIELLKLMGRSSDVDYGVVENVKTYSEINQYIRQHVVIPQLSAQYREPDSNRINTYMDMFKHEIISFDETKITVFKHEKQYIQDQLNLYPLLGVLLVNEKEANVTTKNDIKQKLDAIQTKLNTCIHDVYFTDERENKKLKSLDWIADVRSLNELAQKYTSKVKCDYQATELKTLDDLCKFVSDAASYSFTQLKELNKQSKLTVYEWAKTQANVTQLQNAKVVQSEKEILMSRLQTLIFNEQSTKMDETKLNPFIKFLNTYFNTTLEYNSKSNNTTLQNILDVIKSKQTDVKTLYETIWTFTLKLKVASLSKNGNSLYIQIKKLTEWALIIEKIVKEYQEYKTEINKNRYFDAFQDDEFIKSVSDGIKELVQAQKMIDIDYKDISLPSETPLRWNLEYIEKIHGWNILFNDVFKAQKGEAEKRIKEFKELARKLEGYVHTHVCKADDLNTSKKPNNSVKGIREWFKDIIESKLLKPFGISIDLVSEEILKFREQIESYVTQIAPWIQTVIFGGQQTLARIVNESGQESDGEDLEENVKMSKVGTIDEMINQLRSNNNLLFNAFKKMDLKPFNGDEDFKSKNIPSQLVWLQNELATIHFVGYSWLMFKTEQDIILKYSNEFPRIASTQSSNYELSILKNKNKIIRFKDWAKAIVQSIRGDGDNNDLTKEQLIKIMDDFIAQRNGEMLIQTQMDFNNFDEDFKMCRKDRRILIQVDTNEYKNDVSEMKKLYNQSLDQVDVIISNCKKSIFNESALSVSFDEKKKNAHFEMRIGAIQNEIKHLFEYITTNLSIDNQSQLLSAQDEKQNYLTQAVAIEQILRLTKLAGLGDRSISVHAIEAEQFYTLISQYPQTFITTTTPIRVDNISITTTTTIKLFYQKVDEIWNRITNTGEISSLYDEFFPDQFNEIFVQTFQNHLPHVEAWLKLLIHYNTPNNNSFHVPLSFKEITDKLNSYFTQIHNFEQKFHLVGEDEYLFVYDKFIERLNTLHLMVITCGFVKNFPEEIRVLTHHYQIIATKNILTFQGLNVIVKVMDNISNIMLNQVITLLRNSNDNIKKIVPCIFNSNETDRIFQLMDKNLSNADGNLIQIYNLCRETIYVVSTMDIYLQTNLNIFIFHTRPIPHTLVDFFNAEVFDFAYSALHPEPILISEEENEEETNVTKLQRTLKCHAHQKTVFNTISNTTCSRRLDNNDLSLAQQIKAVVTANNTITYQNYLSIFQCSPEQIGQQLSALLVNSEEDDIMDDMNDGDEKYISSLKIYFQNNDITNKERAIDIYRAINRCELIQNFQQYINAHVSSRLIFDFFQWKFIDKVIDKRMSDTINESLMEFIKMSFTCFFLIHHLQTGDKSKLAGIFNDREYQYEKLIEMLKHPGIFVKCKSGLHLSQCIVEFIQNTKQSLSFSPYEWSELFSDSISSYIKDFHAKRIQYRERVVEEYELFISANVANFDHNQGNASTLEERLRNTSTFNKNETFNQFVSLNTPIHMHTYISETTDKYHEQTKDEIQIFAENLNLNHEIDARLRVYAFLLFLDSSERKSIILNSEEQIVDAWVNSEQRSDDMRQVVYGPCYIRDQILIFCSNTQMNFKWLSVFEILQNKSLTDMGKIHFHQKLIYQHLIDSNVMEIEECSILFNTRSIRDYHEDFLTRLQKLNVNLENQFKKKLKEKYKISRQYKEQKEPIEKICSQIILWTATTTRRLLQKEDNVETVQREKLINDAGLLDFKLICTTIENRVQTISLGQQGRMEDDSNEDEEGLDLFSSTDHKEIDVKYAANQLCTNPGNFDELKSSTFKTYPQLQSSLRPSVSLILTDYLPLAKPLSQIISNNLIYRFENHFVPFYTRCPRGTSVANAVSFFCQSFKYIPWHSSDYDTFKHFAFGLFLTNNLNNDDEYIPKRGGEYEDATLLDLRKGQHGFITIDPLHRKETWQTSVQNEMITRGISEENIQYVKRIFYTSGIVNGTVLDNAYFIIADLIYHRALASQDKTKYRLMPICNDNSNVRRDLIATLVKMRCSVDDAVLPFVQQVFFNQSTPVSCEKLEIVLKITQKMNLASFPWTVSNLNDILQTLEEYLLLDKDSSDWTLDTNYVLQKLLISDDITTDEKSHLKQNNKQLDDKMIDCLLNPISNLDDFNYICDFLSLHGKIEWMDRVMVRHPAYKFHKTYINEHLLGKTEKDLEKRITVGFMIRIKEHFNYTVEEEEGDDVYSLCIKIYRSKCDDNTATFDDDMKVLVEEAINEWDHETVIRYIDASVILTKEGVTTDDQSKMIHMPAIKALFPRLDQLGRSTFIRMLSDQNNTENIVDIFNAQLNIFLESPSMEINLKQTLAHLGTTELAKKLLGNDIFRRRERNPEMCVNVEKAIRFIGKYYHILSLFSKCEKELHNDFFIEDTLEFVMKFRQIFLNREIDEVIIQIIQTNDIQLLRFIERQYNEEEEEQTIHICTIDYWKQVINAFTKSNDHGASLDQLTKRYRKLINAGFSIEQSLLFTFDQDGATKLLTFSVEVICLTYQFDKNSKCNEEDYDHIIEWLNTHDKFDSGSGIFQIQSELMKYNDKYFMDLFANTLFRSLNKWCWLFALKLGREIDEMQMTWKTIPFELHNITIDWKRDGKEMYEQEFKDKVNILLDPPTNCFRDLVAKYVTKKLVLRVQNFSRGFTLATNTFHEKVKINHESEIFQYNEDKNQIDCITACVIPQSVTNALQFNKKINDWPLDEESNEYTDAIEKYAISLYLNGTENFSDLTKLRYEIYDMYFKLKIYPGTVWQIVENLIPDTQILSTDYITNLLMIEREKYPMLGINEWAYIASVMYDNTDGSFETEYPNFFDNCMFLKNMGEVATSEDVEELEQFKILFSSSTQTGPIKQWITTHIGKRIQSLLPTALQTIINKGRKYYISQRMTLVYFSQYVLDYPGQNVHLALVEILKHQAFGCLDGSVQTKILSFAKQINSEQEKEEEENGDRTARHYIVTFTHEEKQIIEKHILKTLSEQISDISVNQSFLSEDGENIKWWEQIFNPIFLQLTTTTENENQTNTEIVKQYIESRFKLNKLLDLLEISNFTSIDQEDLGIKTKFELIDGIPLENVMHMDETKRSEQKYVILKDLDFYLGNLESIESYERFCRDFNRKVHDYQEMIMQYVLFVTKYIIIEHDDPEAEFAKHRIYDKKLFWCIANTKDSNTFTDKVTPDSNLPAQNLWSRCRKMYENQLPNLIKQAYIEMIIYTTNDDYLKMLYLTLENFASGTWSIPSTWDISLLNFMDNDDDENVKLFTYKNCLMDSENNIDDDDEEGALKSIPVYANTFSHGGECRKFRTAYEEEIFDSYVYPGYYLYNLYNIIYETKNIIHHPGVSVIFNYVDRRSFQYFDELKDFDVFHKYNNPKIFDDTNKRIMLNLTHNSEISDLVEDLHLAKIGFLYMGGAYDLALTWKKIDDMSYFMLRKLIDYESSSLLQDTPSA